MSQPDLIQPMSVTTQRLVLRTLRPNDRGPLYRIHADPETMQYASSPPWCDQGEADDYIRRDLDSRATRSGLRLAITLTGSAQLIGVCSLVSIVTAHQYAEIGYVLAPSARGRGYMREALNALVTLSFRDLGLSRIEASVDPRNVPSVKVLEGLGFVCEGVLRRRTVVADRAVDSAIFAVFAEVWETAGASSIVTKSDF